MTNPDSPHRINGFDFDDDLRRSEDSGFEDPRAFLQPCMSATATHLTSWDASEFEKRAALRKRPTGDIHYFASKSDDSDSTSEQEDSEESTPDADITPRSTPPASAQEGPHDRNNLNLGSLPDQKLTKRPSVALPSPWVSGPRELVISTPEDDKPRQRPSNTFLQSAFGYTSNDKSQRPRRSGSAGQDALRRLREAVPSAPQLHFHMLPTFHGSSKNLPSRSDSTSSDDNDSSRPSTPSGAASTWSLRRKPVAHQGGRENEISSQSTSWLNSNLSNDREAQAERKKAGARPTMPSIKTGSVLRRTASDESILYHTLTPQTSLDDGQFNHVHEMVNIRFMAIKESLPSLPKAKVGWRPSLNLSGLNVSDTPKKSFTETAPAGVGPSQPCEPTPESVDAALARPSPEDPLDRVLASLTGDIVVMGGYRGSILRSAAPPHQQLWAPVKVGLNMRKVNLEVGLSDEEEADMSKTVRPGGMLKHMGPVDVSRKFIRRLKSCENARNGRLRVWDYGYDWRLSPHRLSHGLAEFLARLPSNQPGVPLEDRGALVVAHSLGGLITRHAVNQRPELFSGVLYAGVPQRTINILGPLRNGDAVLLNEKLLTAAVNFSIRTTFVFLPEDGCAFVDKVTGEPYHVDFYNAEDWARWRISPCVGGPPRLAPPKPQSSSFASFIPSSLRPRGNSKSDKKPHDGSHTVDNTIAPHMSTRQPSDRYGIAKETPEPDVAEQKRYMEYLTRTLARTKRFRAELAHLSSHEEQNTYPPMAVLYGKSVPTVYAAQVNGREGITRSDAYDDLLFRAGDGVTLAKQAMLPEGYNMVKGGKVCTDRGHITMLGDLPAVGKALEAVMRGRNKGIGLGEGRKRGSNALRASH